MQWEVQHDPLAHEGVAMVALPGKHRQPHPHAVGAAVQPQAGSQVGLVWVGAPGEPDRFAAGGKNGGQGLEKMQSFMFMPSYIAEITKQAF